MGLERHRTGAGCPIHSATLVGCVSGQDDDKDPAGNLCIPMNGSEATVCRQSDDRPIYGVVEVEGAA